MLSTTKKQRKQINDGVDQGNLCQLYFFYASSEKKSGRKEGAKLA